MTRGLGLQTLSYKCVRSFLEDEAVAGIVVPTER